MPALYTIPASLAAAFVACGRTGRIQAWQGRTPDEVYFGKNFRRAGERISYFDGALEWWRFG